MRISVACLCGSALSCYEMYDARGIFCAFVCDSCKEKRQKEFRPDIFTDPNYPTSEPIEDD